LLHYLPAAGEQPEKMIIQYARRSFTGYWGLPRSSDIPPITEAQAEALDALHFTAEKYAASLNFKKGDIQYVNNLSIFHARAGFRDSGEAQYVCLGYPPRAPLPVNLLKTASHSAVVERPRTCMANPGRSSRSVGSSICGRHPRKISFPPRS